MLAQLIESISAINLVAGIIWTLLGAVIGTSLLLKRQHAPIQTLTTIACLLLAIVGAGMQFSPLLPNESLSLSFAQGFEIAFYCLLGLVLILLTLQTLKRGGAQPSQDQELGSQEHLRIAVDGTSDGLWVWNINDDTVWFSPRMKALMGFKANEFPDQFEAWENQLHPDDHEPTLKAIEQHLKENVDYDITYRLRCKDESYRWFRARGLATRNEDGKPLRMAGSIQDIHEQYQNREKLAQNEELFRGVFERANIGIALTDKDGKFCEVNPALCKMLKFDSEALKTRSFRSVTHPDDLEKSSELHTQLEENPKNYLELEKRYIRKDGEIIHAITGVSRIQKKGSRKGAQTLVHIQDVTKLKNAERKAVESSHFKSQFLAHMSHEIRTPLGGLLGMIELALGTELSDEQEHFLVTAKRSSEQLMFLINDILDLSKIEAGKLEIFPERFSLRETTSNMISTLSLKAHEKGLELAYHIDDTVPEFISADWSRIQQVLTNLLSNAIKFTQKGQVVLEIKLDRRSNTSTDKPHQTIPIAFSVSDTGIGIPSDKCREIFEAFQHADSSIPQKYGGTGLGLAISQELVSLMGGKISVESEVGSGSRFSFYLPIKSETASIPDVARDYGNLKALIIDDNQTSLEFLFRTLLSYKIHPTGFTSTAAALSFLHSQTNRTGKFDLCLLDNRIPGNEAFGFPARIAAHLNNPDNFILLLSSPNRELELARCRDFNLKHYLTKPVATNDLLGLLDRLNNHIPESDEPSESEKKRILVVEDNPINSEVALNFIKQFGHEVQCVENGQEAVDTLQKDSFDIVLMDLQMPEMSGLEATKIIRERETSTGKHQWIIALTAQAMKGDREECLAAGMDDYITKPIKREELQTGLERAKISLSPKPQTSTPANADPSSIIKAFDGEINVAKKVSQLFLETTPSLWDSLVKSIQNGDAKNLQSTAHRLKGSYMQFGAEEAEQLAYKLETAGRNNKLEDLADTIQQLQDHTRDLKKQIYQLLRH
ncbi:response regulator [Verrucomicrobia bacterium]|nr:response regulator [Verrucomicrobiota bacterium]